MMFLAAAAALIAAMILALARAFAGPTVYDRILAVNHIGSQTVLLIAVMGFITGRPDFLDISLLYALINFVATIAVLRYVKRGRAQADKQS
jgi:multicomponent Na+:H+ antiporter subunit F|tara:strand:- start:240 stop:512 length:273 start_codon:yes stop_codon:yes gene_type:complete